MRFLTIQPSFLLQNVVECFIISENETTTPYAVFPDAALVMGFQYKGRLSLVKNEEEEKLSVAGVTGLQNNLRIFKNNEPSASILVRFKPGGAAALFAVPLHELFEKSVSLDMLIGHQHITLIEEKLLEVNSDTERIRVIEEFLLSIARKNNGDKLVHAAIELIKQSAGTIRITELAKLLNTSASPLEKRFRSVVGCTPKKYAAIIRFRNIIDNKEVALAPAERAYRAGYFDQAHFIKDFKRFTGQTPDDFFSAKMF